jgi:membrane-bound ClpP family serine protease
MQRQYHRQLIHTALLALVVATSAEAQTATPPAAKGPAVVVIPTEGPIEWKYTVECFEKAMKMAASQKPEAMILQINSPGGVVEYTWDMVNQFKAMSDCKTIGWVNGKQNGAFSSGAIFAMACDKLYIAQGQAIGAAVPYELGSYGIPRDVSLKWRSAWHAQLRSLCEMKHRPWPVVYALVSTSAGLYKMKTAKGVEYVNYDKIRPLLKPEFVTELDVVVKAEKEESENTFEGHANISRRERISFKDGMPPNVQIICNVGDVLTLTSQEAVECGLCDGIADSVEDVMKAAAGPADARMVTLADPFKQSNQHMNNVVKMFLASMSAVGGSVARDTEGTTMHQARLHFRGAEALSNARSLAEYRKIRSLMDRYPDLVTSPEARAQVDASITHIQDSLQKQKDADRAAHEREMRTNRPPTRMTDRLN